MKTSLAIAVFLAITEASASHACPDGTTAAGREGRTQFCVNEAGLKQGPFKAWFPDGKLRLEGKFNADGKRQGVWKAYHADGKPRWERAYAKGRKHGAEVTYHPGGAKATEG